jgi:Tol biopolymer transport system component
VSAMPFSFRVPAGVLALLLLAACDNPARPDPDPEPKPTVPAAPADALAVLNCTAQVRTLTVICKPYDPATDTEGGAEVNARLASAGASYDAQAGVFSVNLTVQNLRVERMGTADGPTVAGVHVHFLAGPWASNGKVQVRNAEGSGPAGQPYYRWPQVLALDAVSQPRRLEFSVPSVVQSFKFWVYVQAPLLPVVVFDRVTEANRDIWRVALDGSDLVRLTTHGGEERDPTAGGRTVVFTTFRHGGRAELYSVPLAGGAETRLTTTNVHEAQPALTRDGTRLAYTSDAGGISKVWTANANASGAARATPATFGEGAPETAPAWRPGGNRLTLVALVGETADLFDLAAGGAPALLLPGNSASEVDPAWSADGTHVAYASGAAGSPDIYMMRVADGVVTRLTTGGQTEAYPTWTTDGRIVYLEFLAGGGTRLRWLDPDVPGSGGEIAAPGGTANRPHAVPF